MKLIVISSSKNKLNESKIMTELFENGLNTYHLRKPSMSTKDMSKLIEEVPEHFHKHIVIHSHHKLASKFQLKGIHLTSIHIQRKFSTWFRLRMIRMRNENITISTSFHKLGHVYTNDLKCNYALLGTMFDRLTGNFNAGYSEHTVRTVNQKSEIPLIARGGTNVRQIEKCVDLGFAGMAFSSALWDSESPVKTWINILDRFRELSITTE